MENYYFEIIPSDITKIIIAQLTYVYQDLENFILAFPNLESYIDEIFGNLFNNQILFEVYKINSKNYLLHKYYIYKTISYMNHKLVDTLAENIKTMTYGVFCQGPCDFRNLDILNIQGINYKGILLKHINIINKLVNINITYKSKINKYQIAIHYFINGNSQWISDFTSELSEFQLKVLLYNVLYSGLQIEDNDHSDVIDAVLFPNHYR